MSTLRERLESWADCGIQRWTALDMLNLLWPVIEAAMSEDANEYENWKQLNEALTELEEKLK